MSDWVSAVEIEARISWHGKIPTVHSKVFEGGVGCLLNTGVVTVEEVEDCIEGFAFDGLAPFSSNFCKSEGSSSLKINVFVK